MSFRLFKPSFRLIVSLLVIVASLLLVAPQLATAAPKRRGLESQMLKGQKYYTMRSFKEFYGFTKMRRSGNQLILDNSDVNMVITLGGQTCIMNGVKFIFSFPVQRVGGRILISQIDVVKLVDPVLRPEYIPNADKFRTVILDPGHGGYKSGAPSRYGNEKTYTLQVCRILKKILEGAKYRVVMTRNSDKHLTLSERVAFANRYKNAIFISVHFNSGGGSRASGIETFTLSPEGVAHYGRGLKTSDLVARVGNRQDSANIALATAVHHLAVKDCKTKDRGIKRARFSVLTGIKHPAILLEGGFLDHPHEAKRIHSLAYQKTLARAIARAVLFYHRGVSRAKR